jgi:Icc-related predicted phosphoesterase
MKILAFSDLHGHFLRQATRLIKVHQPDWIVLLGNILPDFDEIGIEAIRLKYQQKFWRTHAAAFQKPGSPLTFIRGNHEMEDFEVPSEHQRLPAGLESRVIRLEGIPNEFGAFGWNREGENDTLQAELHAQLAQFPQADIVFCHVPPYGCLDEAEPGNHAGNRPLGEYLSSVEGTHVSLVLCGHLHEAMGIGRCGKAKVVNLAAGFAVLDDETGAWKVRKLETMSSYAGQERFLAEEESALEDRTPALEDSLDPGFSARCFNYRTRSLPDNLTGLCYSRCLWEVDERRGVVLERAPGTCWEGAHNALLQAAAPGMYEALQAVVRADAGAMEGAMTILNAVEDQAWLDLVGKPGKAMFTPRQVLAIACGLDGQEAAN